MQPDKVPSLVDFLIDSAAFNSFHSFLQQEYASESLDFYQDVSQFKENCRRTFPQLFPHGERKKDFDATVDAVTASGRRASKDAIIEEDQDGPVPDAGQLERLFELAKPIYLRFVHPEAENEVNIPAAASKVLHSIFDDAIPHNNRLKALVGERRGVGVYDQSLRCIVDLMHSDPWLRYLVSKQYKEYTEVLKPAKGAEREKQEALQKVQRDEATKKISGLSKKSRKAMRELAQWFRRNTPRHDKENLDWTQFKKFSHLPMFLYRRLFAIMDQDKTKKISLAQFVRWMHMLTMAPTPDNKPDKFTLLFNILDFKTRGRISRVDATRVMWQAYHSSFAIIYNDDEKRDMRKQRLRFDLAKLKMARHQQDLVEVARQEALKAEDDAVILEDVNELFKSSGRKLYMYHADFVKLCTESPHPPAVIQWWLDALVAHGVHSKARYVANVLKSAGVF